MAEADGTGTPDVGGEGQGTGQPAAPAAPAADETSVLRSRLAGQDAKITTLTQANSEAAARAATAEAKLAAYEQGKVGTDEALRAQLAAEAARADRAEQATTVALRKATYPEAFRELGDQIVSMDEAKLASLEARLTANTENEPAGDATDGITPRVPGAPRPRTTNNQPKDETSADVLARLKAQGLPWQQQ